MIANDSFKYIALYVNCSLCYVTKVKGEWLPRTKNTLTTMPQDKKPQKSKDEKALLWTSPAARSVESLIKIQCFLDETKVEPRYK